jgi:hypothetical protein
MGIREKLKEENIEMKIDETDDDIIVTLEIIKPLKGQKKEFLKVSINADRLTADLNDANYFGLQEFNYNKIDTEIVA